MKLTAEDLKAFNVIDEIIPETMSLDVDKTFGYEALKKSLNKAIKQTKKISIELLLKKTV